MQVKKCENIPDYKGRYSPPTFIGAESFVQWGDPDADHISTSFVGRRNLSMRMGQQHSKPGALRHSAADQGRYRPLRTTVMRSTLGPQ